MRSANGVGLFVIQSSHQPCRFPMLIEVAFVITAGALGLALGATIPMLAAALALGRADALALGLADVLALGRADALARGDIDGDADGRGAAGAGNTGGSTNGDSMS